MRVPVIVIRADDFLNLRACPAPARGRDSPEGFWLDTYDYETLFRDVLVPLGRGGNGCYRPVATDHRQDVRLSPPIRSRRQRTRWLSSRACSFTVTN